MGEKKTFQEIEDIPSGNNWMKVLLEVLDSAPHTYGESHAMGFNDDDHPLARKLKITGYELMLAVSFLESNGLVSRTNDKGPLDDKSINPGWSSQLMLTSKGFDIATKLMEKKSSENFTKWLVIFAGVTAMVGLKDLIEGFGVDESFASSIILVLIGFLVIVGVFWTRINDRMASRAFKHMVKRGKGAL